MAERTLTDRVPRVLVKEKIAEAGVDLLRRDFEVELGLDWDDDELGKRIGEFDAILIRSGTKLTADLIAKADRMRVDRPRRNRRRQRRPRGRDQARDHRRQRPRVELRRRRRAHDGDGPRPLPQGAPGPRSADRRALGALPLRGQRALRQDAGGDRLRADRPARRPPCAVVRDGGDRLRQVRCPGALPRAWGGGDRGHRRALRPRRPDHDPPAEDTGHDQLDRRRGDRRDEGRGPHRQLRPRRAGRPRRARGRPRVRADRRRRARRLPLRAVHRARPLRPRRRRRHPAPGRLDRRGAGPGRNGHGRTGSRRPLRRRRHQRGQHHRPAAGAAGPVRAALRAPRPPGAGPRPGFDRTGGGRVPWPHCRIRDPPARDLRPGRRALGAHRGAGQPRQRPGAGGGARARAGRDQGHRLRRLHRAGHRAHSAPGPTRSRSRAPGSGPATTPTSPRSGAPASTSRSTDTSPSFATPTPRG